MKNVKVNIINRKGKKTSTTINVSIATFYYKYCVPQADKDYIKDINDCMQQHDAAIAFRNKSVQDFVNRLIEEVSSYAKGVDQEFIEIRLLNAIKFSD